MTPWWVGMDTRRMPSSNGMFHWPTAAPVSEEVDDVEVVEVRHIERPIRGLVNRLVFVVFLVLLAASIAVAGMPARSGWYIKTPLPNLFSFDIAF